MTFQRHDDRAEVGGAGLVGAEAACSIRCLENRRRTKTRLEVAGEHRCSWEGRLGRVAGALDGVLPAREEKELVFLDRAANRAAKLIALQGRAEGRSHASVGIDYGGGSEGGVLGIEHEIPNVLENVPVE